MLQMCRAGLAVLACQNDAIVQRRGLDGRALRGQRTHQCRCMCTELRQGYCVSGVALLSSDCTCFAACAGRAATAAAAAALRQKQGASAGRLSTLLHRAVGRQAAAAIAWSAGRTGLLLRESI